MSDGNRAREASLCGEKELRTLVQRSSRTELGQELILAAQVTMGSLLDWTTKTKKKGGGPS